MLSQHMVRIGIVVAAGALSTACGSTTSSGSAPAASPAASPAVSPAVSPAASPAASSAASSAPLPTLTEPSAPPKEPTDTLPENGWVAGMVTRGGSGPCYGITADDGTRYALYNTEGITLKDKARVRVKLETTLIKIYCGPGDLKAMTEAAPIG